MLIPVNTSIQISNTKFPDFGIDCTFGIDCASVSVSVVCTLGVVFSLPTYSLAVVVSLMDAVKPASLVAEL